MGGLRTGCLGQIGNIIRQHHKATLFLLFVGPEKDRFRLRGQN